MPFQVFVTVLLMATLLTTVNGVVEKEELSEAELELKRAIDYVKPLMAILTNNKVENSQVETGRQGGCCDYGTDYVGILSLIALGLLGFYLITLLSTTTTAATGGRKKRSLSDRSDNEIS
jgi:hypothetical protein